jgi:hypothetical protein
MDKQTKTLLMVGAGALALYLILRPKGGETQVEPQNENRGEGNSIAQDLVDEYNQMASKQVSEGRSQFNQSEGLRAIEINKKLNSLGYAMSSQVPATLITLDEYNKKNEDYVTTGLVNDPLAEMRTRHNAPSTSVPIFAEASGFKKNRNKFRVLIKGGR